MELINKISRRIKEIQPYLAKTAANEYFLLSLLFILGAYFRFKGLNFQSLWFDELLTVFRTSPDLSFSEVIANYQTDPHPPLFFLTIHYWMSIFGYNEVAARFLVAIIGSVSVISVYWLGKECLDKKTGFLATLFVSFNFYNLHFSQEVRPYILLFLFTTLSYTAFLRLIREPNRKNSVIYGVFTALMMYSHYYGLIHLLAQLIFLLFYFVFEQNILRKTLLKYFSFSGIVITILYSPWIPTTLRMLQKTKHWNPKPKSDFFLSLFNRFFASEPYLVVIFTALILLLLFYFISIRKNDPAHVNETDPAAGTIDLKLHLSIPVLFSWMFFTLFIPYFRSLVTVPMYYPKYAIGTLPVIMVMAAMCIILFKNRTFKALLIASIVLVSLTSLFLSVEYYNKVRKQNWRGTAEYVLKQSAQKYPNKEIFILTEHPELYRFYFDSLEPKVEQIRELPKLPGKLKRALKNLVDRNENIGIWLLPGHKFKPAKSVTAFLDQHFIQLEKKNLGLGEAVLYEPQKEKKIPDTHQ